MGESIFGMKHIQLTTGREEPLTLLQRVAISGRVELIRLVEEFDRSAQVQVGRRFERRTASHAGEGSAGIRRAKAVCGSLRVRAAL